MKKYFEQRTALGGEATLVIVGNLDNKALQKIFSLLWSRVTAFENNFSRFNNNSQLTGFNLLAGDKVTISEEFYDLLSATKRMSRLTDGLFNPFVLPVLHSIGYKSGFGNKLTEKQLTDFSARGVAAHTKLELGKTWARIPKNSALDLGGCGKGYLADQLADELDKHQDIKGYWMALGGDIVSKGNDSNEAPWSIGIQSAQELSKDVGELIMPVQRFAVATSGVTKRKGISHQKTWHHIINPRTLEPAWGDLAQATVSHPSALSADVLATCAIILGSTKTTKFLKEHSVNDYLLQTADTKKRVLSGKRIQLYNSFIHG